MSIMIPSKTFLLGEYLALKGGPALIALTNPSFSIDPNKTLHPDCMAAKFWTKLTKTPCRWGLNDPYQGKGGLGASSAEFLLAYQQLYGNFKNLQHLHQCYLECASPNATQKPSGYDVLAQTSNACAVVETNPISVTSLPWIFSDIGFFLIHTGKKLKTHEHLQKGLEISHWQQMAKATEQAILGLESNQADLFVQAILSFAQCLSRSGFVASHSQILIEQFQSEPILAVKGCGALGADVIFIVYEKQYKAYLKEKYLAKGLDILATEADLFFENAKK
jgi:mevalonate kinase